LPFRPSFLQSCNSAILQSCNFPLLLHGALRDILIVIGRTTGMFGRSPTIGLLFRLVYGLGRLLAGTGTRRVRGRRSTEFVVFGTVRSLRIVLARVRACVPCFHAGPPAHMMGACSKSHAKELPPLRSPVSSKLQPFSTQCRRPRQPRPIVRHECDRSYGSGGWISGMRHALSQNVLRAVRSRRRNSEVKAS